MFFKERRNNGIFVNGRKCSLGYGKVNDGSDRDKKNIKTRFEEEEYFQLFAYN